LDQLDVLMNKAMDGLITGKGHVGGAILYCCLFPYGDNEEFPSVCFGAALPRGTGMEETSRRELDF
jgi:hypothetical protein